MFLKKVILLLFLYLTLSLDCFSQSSHEEVPDFLNSKFNSSSIRFNPSTLALNKDLGVDFSAFHSGRQKQFVSFDLLGSYSNFGASVYYNRNMPGITAGFGYGNYLTGKLRGGVYTSVAYTDRYNIAGNKQKVFDLMQSVGIAYDFSKRFSASIVYSQTIVSGGKFTLEKTTSPMIGIKYNPPKLDFMTMYLDFYDYKPKLGIEFQVMKNLSIIGFGSGSVYGIGISFNLDIFGFGGTRNQKMSNDGYSSSVVNLRYRK